MGKHGKTRMTRGVRGETRLIWGKRDVTGLTRGMCG